MTLEAFAPSQPLTLGVELELQLVSLRDYDLTRAATDSEALPEAILVSVGHRSSLTDNVDYAIPFGCLRRIALMNLSENSLTYSALAGFLQSIGLAPDRYLEGMLEE